MAKLNNHEQQLLSTEYGSNVINTSAVGSASSNSMSTTFPSNHHLLVRHAAIEISPPAISHSQHQLNSGNSFELSGVTTSSLSEDSGLPLTTNSSISSGDSTRMGLCKFEFEVYIQLQFIRNGKINGQINVMNILFTFISVCGRK